MEMQFYLTMDNDCDIVLDKQYNREWEIWKEGEGLAWNFNSNAPIYVQIMDVLKQRIVSEEIKAGEKIPSVRDLAQEAGVNPNTMQRALTELEREALLYTVRTSGRFVTVEKNRIEEEKQRLAKEKILELMSSLEKLGFSREEIAALLKKAVETAEMQKHEVTEIEYVEVKEKAAEPAALVEVKKKEGMEEASQEEKTL